MPVFLKQITSHFWKMACFWTAAILVLFAGDLWHIDHAYKEAALVQARAYLEKDQAVRRWAAGHGGVYVPITEKTHPNPFLDDLSDRDIPTPDGKVLTLMNSAYMMRQINREFEQQSSVLGHITGLKYFRPETAPDDWEKKVLASFEKSDREVYEFCDFRGQPYLRIMQPLIMESSCLKCHAEQGYQVGDISGGVSVTMPLQTFLRHRGQDIVLHAFSFVMLWLIGTMGLVSTSRKLAGAVKKRDEAVVSLKLAEENNQILIQNSLTGIYTTQDGKITFCNAKFARIHGYTAEELLGLPSEDLVHPLDRNDFAALCRKRNEGRQVPDEYEIRCLTRYGRTIWVQRRNTLIMQAGRPAVLGNEIEITEKKQAEEELRASEAFFKNLIVRFGQDQEKERKTIALELHEEIAQSLSAVKISIESTLDDTMLNTSPGARHLLSAIERIKNVIDLMRRLTRRLSPIMIDELGIQPAMTALCREVQQACQHIEITSRIDIDETHVPGALKIVIYRVLEDLLNHLTGRCAYNRLNVSLTKEGGHLALLVETQACAGQQQVRQAPGKVATMMEVKKRVEVYGGTMTVESRADLSQIIKVCWPMEGNPKS